MDKTNIKQKIFKDEEIKVNIIDELMGAGKTSAAINFINNSPKDSHFLYITPYLTEVDRIIKKCPEKNFKQPERKGTKINGIKELFERKENIVSTHALFRYFDEEIIDIAHYNNYILIMDEVAEVIEQYHVSKDDLVDILTNYAHVDEETKLLVWDYEEYTGCFDNIKKLCELNSITVYKDTAMLWLFPITTFRAFRETYILTYMFNAQTQSYYYNYYNIQYNRLYVKHENGEYQFTKEPTSKACKYDFRKLINICDIDKLNFIGEKPHSLSKSWYERNTDNSLIEQLQKNTGNYFKNIVKSPSEKNIWTTFKDYQSLLSGKGYAKGYVASNMRATNEYMDRDCIAYLVNKYFNPNIKQFFVMNGITVNEDGYAISEMLQFIWRSAIRRGNPINLYIPSKRMRDLLINWINSQEYGDQTVEPAEKSQDKKEVLKFNGEFYFGFHSNIITNKESSQIKGIKKVTGDNIEIIILQFSDKENKFIKQINNNDYILKANIEYIKLSPTVYQATKIGSCEKVILNKYNSKIIGRIHKKLCTMRKQTRFKETKQI